MRIRTADQDQDARIVVDDDGVTAVIFQAGLLSARSEAVVRRVLSLLDNPSEVVPYPGNLGYGDPVDEPM